MPIPGSQRSTLSFGTENRKTQLPVINALKGAIAIKEIDP